MRSERSPSESQLMDSLNPADPPRSPVIPRQRAAAHLEVLGHGLWGLFIFAAMFVGQIAVVAWFVLRQEGPIDIAAAIHVRRRRPDDFTLRDHGTARGARGAVGRDPSVAHAVRRLSRAALDLVDQCCDRRRRAVRAGHGVGPAVARDGPRNDARISWARC